MATNKGPFPSLAFIASAALSNNKGAGVKLQVQDPAPAP